jgi:riboflavin synthase
LELATAQGGKLVSAQSVRLIPEKLRMTTFADKAVGAAPNVEIERPTQVLADTVRAKLEERLGPLLPALQVLARTRDRR